MWLVWGGLRRYGRQAMGRRLLVLVLLATVLVVGGAVALVLTARPDLDDGRRAVDTRWSTLRGPLATRYAGLAQLATALGAAGAGERTYTVDLVDEVGTWDRLAGRDADPASEVMSANRLEGLATRVRTNVAHSARLSQDPGITEALAAFDTALVPTPDVDAYNRAVRRYQSTRTDTVKQIPADLLGFDARPVLVLGAGPTPG